MEVNNRITVGEAPENIFKDLLTKYLLHWKWFLLSMALAFVLAFVYLRYQAPVYEVNATILIKDDKKGGSISDEVSAFEDLGILKNARNIDNEIEILKSRSLMKLVVAELNLDVSYFSYGRPIEHERFFDTPIKLNYVAKNKVKSDWRGNWQLIPQSKQNFILQSGNNGEKIGTFAFGDSVRLENATLIFTTTEYFTETYLNKEFRVKKNSVDGVVNHYITAIKVTPVNKNANAITLSLRDPIPDKAAAIVDNLIKQHNLDAIFDKNEVSTNTANFINERIQYITEDLSDVESEAESFKKRYKLTDVESEAKLFLESGAQSEMNLLDVSTQLRIADFMNEYIKKHANTTELIPSNISFTDPVIGSQINDYNKLVLERNRILKNAGEQNPIVQDMKEQIDGLRAAILQGLLNFRNTLQIREKEMTKKDQEITSKIGTVPKYEREYRSIQRQQQIKEALYLYLLQKREETNIALAVTVSNAKVVDSAYSNGVPVAPKKGVIYLFAILAGIMAPVIIFYVIAQLDTKIHTRKDIDALALPFLGDIPQVSTKEKIVVQANNHSNIAEAFRLLRTNVDFLNQSNYGSSKTVFVTSTIGKEGKSFIALNLAVSFALSGKKTLLIGTDLRNPKLLAYLDMHDRPGLTNLVTDRSLILEDVILTIDAIPYLNVLPSGAIPPNPAELLMQPRIAETFADAKQKYDYIIVDTAPVGLVTDTLLISRFADCTVYVARANFLDKRILKLAETLYREGRLPNMAVLINGSDQKKSYGYGYGYGYGVEKEKGILSRIFNFN